MFSKILTAATVALALTFATSTKAQAAPLFLTPDVNFASTGDALFVSGPHDYSVNINTAIGDSMVIDNGTGFTTLSSSVLSVSVSGSTGSLVLNIGGELGSFMTADMISSKLTNTSLGHDIFALFRVTESTIGGFNVGALVGFDVLAYNCHDISNRLEACKVKGDVAPVVPEPATLSLLVLGVCGLASTRRKLIG